VLHVVGCQLAQTAGRDRVWVCTARVPSTSRVKSVGGEDVRLAGRRGPGSWVPSHRFPTHPVSGGVEL